MPTPVMRAGRRHSARDYDQDSITSAARIVVTRVWKHAERDRRVLEHKLENHCNKVITHYQDGFRQGVIAVRHLHDSYVLPRTLAPSFLMGFLACLTGVLTGLFILLNIRGFLNS